MSTPAPMLSVSLDDGDIHRYLHTYVARGERPPLRRIGVVMQAMVSRNFQERGRPQKWAPLTENTKAARKRGGGVPLQDTGALKKSVNIRMQYPDQVAAHSEHDVAAFHQFGTRPYVIRPKRPGGVLRFTVKGAGGRDKGGRFTASKSTASAREVHHPGLPARPFMVWVEDGVEKIKNMLLNDLLG